MLIFISFWYKRLNIPSPSSFRQTWSNLCYVTRPISLAHSPAFCPSPVSCYPLGTASLLGSSDRSQISKLHSLDEYAGPDCINVLTSSSRTQTQDFFWIFSLAFYVCQKMCDYKTPSLARKKVKLYWQDEANGRSRTGLNKINAENANFSWMFFFFSYKLLQAATYLLLASTGGLQSPDDGWARLAIDNLCSEHLHYNQSGPPES